MKETIVGRLPSPVLAATVAELDDGAAPGLFEPALAPGRVDAVDGGDDDEAVVVLPALLPQPKVARTTAAEAAARRRAVALGLDMARPYRHGRRVRIEW